MPDAAAASMEAEVMEGEEGLQGRRGPKQVEVRDDERGEGERVERGWVRLLGVPWNLGWQSD